MPNPVRHRESEPPAVCNPGSICERRTTGGKDVRHGSGGESSVGDARTRGDAVNALR